MSEQDINVPPPFQDRIRVVAIGPAAGIVTLDLMILPADVDRERWWSLVSNVHWYPIFGEAAGDISDPLITAVDGGVEARRCYLIGAYQEKQYKIHASNGVLKIVALADGYLRACPSDHYGNLSY